jgi:hypothetical protein
LSGRFPYPLAGLAVALGQFQEKLVLGLEPGMDPAFSSGIAAS